MVLATTFSALIRFARLWLPEHVLTRHVPAEEAGPGNPDNLLRHSLASFSRRTQVCILISVMSISAAPRLRLDRPTLRVYRPFNRTCLRTPFPLLLLVPRVSRPARSMLPAVCLRLPPRMTKGRRRPRQRAWPAVARCRSRWLQNCT